MFQAIKFLHKNLDVICMYRSQIGSSVTILQELSRIIDVQRPTLIMGDFNTCYRENRNNKLVQGLMNLGFNQLIHEPTHIRGRIIDHAYLLDSKQHFKISIERYTPYYSDHDAICICLRNLKVDLMDLKGKVSFIGILAVSDLFSEI